MMSSEDLKSLRRRAPALICVDIQRGFEDEAYWGGNRNNRTAEAICGRIIENGGSLASTFFMCGIPRQIPIPAFMPAIPALPFIRWPCRKRVSR